MITPIKIESILFRLDLKNHSSSPNTRSLFLEDKGEINNSRVNRLGNV